MTNKYCEGDLFEVEGKKYYRCLLDGTVMEAPMPWDKCPRCERETFAQSHGTLEVRTQRYVVFPSTGWAANLPSN